MTWTKEPPTKENTVDEEFDLETFQAVGAAMTALESIEGRMVRYDLAMKLARAYRELREVSSELTGHPATPPALPVTNDDVATIGYVNTLIERMARIDGKADAERGEP